MTRTHRSQNRDAVCFVDVHWQNVAGRSSAAEASRYSNAPATCQFMLEDHAVPAQLSPGEDQANAETFGLTTCHKLVRVQDNRAPSRVSACGPNLDEDTRCWNCARLARTATSLCRRTHLRRASARTNARFARHASKTSSATCAQTVAAGSYQDQSGRRRTGRVRTF